MAVWERQTQPSFSSSLLDTIYRSIDETTSTNERREVEKDIEALRRSIMIEKWIENHNTTSKTKSAPRHFPSNSDSSTDSSAFSSTETESSTSKSTPKTSHSETNKHARKPPLQKLLPPVKTLHVDTKSNKPAKTTKSRAQKIYGDLKVKLEPISPGGKFSSFFNSVFSPRNVKMNRVPGEWSSPVMKSLSVNDTNVSCSLPSRSCLSKHQFSRGNNNNNNNKISKKNNDDNRSKRSVRFCPVNTVIVDKIWQPDGEKSIRCSGEYSTSSPTIGSQYIKTNIDSFRIYEAKNTRYHHHHHHKNENRDFDDMSCASSDLFELENIRAYEEEEEELPVYGTTSVRMNQVIGSGKKWHF